MHVSSLSDATRYFFTRTQGTFVIVLLHLYLFFNPCRNAGISDKGNYPSQSLFNNNNCKVFIFLVIISNNMTGHFSLPVANILGWTALCFTLKPSCLGRTLTKFYVLDRVVWTGNYLEILDLHPVVFLSSAQPKVLCQILEVHVD